MNPEPSIPIARSDPRAIRESLKEAVADSLLNTIQARLEGSGEFGDVLYGAKPRSLLTSGFLLPMPPAVQQGDENASPIHISAHGIDFQKTEGAEDKITVKPYGSVYIRVLPTRDELLTIKTCQPVFRLQSAVQRQIWHTIRDKEKSALEQLGDRGRRHPEWAKIRETIRAEVYGTYGLTFAQMDVKEVGDVEVEDETNEPRVETLSEGADDAFGAESERTEAGSIEIGNWESLPDDLAQGISPPLKWLRLDLDLPEFSFRSNNFVQKAEEATEALNNAITGQLTAWTNNDDPIKGGKLWAFRRMRQILPSDIRNWEQYLTLVRQSGAAPVLPRIQLRWQVDVRSDYAEQGVLSVHVALENHSPEIDRRSFNDSEESVFQVHLDVTIPREIHRPLMLDRVKPSYRYYQYLGYPALGFNGGVHVKDNSGDTITLATTWAPRYTQPRIIPTSLEAQGVITNMEQLGSKEGLRALRPLVQAFQAWFTKTSSLDVVQGIDPKKGDLITNERRQFDEDKQRWMQEIKSIEAGISILEESAKYWQGEGTPADRMAVPFEAWLAMNKTMAAVGAKKGYSEWRLFQLAFILANLPVLVTRMPEYHSYFKDTIAASADTVTLLYFATGGGKSEAFLGLLVFALFLDRLRGKERGVTAMLRYPLRLLTLQQAQRTARTLAQAEMVRRRRRYPGSPLSLGFWVGSGNTPNRLNDEGVRDIPEVEKIPPEREVDLQNASAYARANEQWNKLPECPFCDEKTGLRRFSALGKLLGHICINSDCSWNSVHSKPTPLPFFIVDEDIYDYAPSVLLGTVDKLALIGQSQRTIRRFLGMFGFAPWRKVSTGRLVIPSVEQWRRGESENGCEALFPIHRDGRKIFFDPFPSLLIQDEAHLLDESLGTFSGLFETALDAALDELALLLDQQCASDPLSGKRRRVKVIAASATVSEPKRQMENLYQRADTVQFPYPGPSLYSSFYAEPKMPDSVKEKDEAERLALNDEEVEQKTHWARLYQTVLTNGRPHTATTVFVLAAFHITITQYFTWLTSGDSSQQERAREELARFLSDGKLRPVFERVLAAARIEDLATLIDIHRTALTYVTNKKGGDQIMAAESSEFEQIHQDMGFDDYTLNAALITGAVDAGHIQDVVKRAEERPKPGEPFYPLNDVLRSIVATSAVSHGVDVEELNSMFFAGMPSDIAEYIQASSRVGRTHVGFCVLIATPQRARDRYIVEVHDIFHRFLERMILPAAIDRWAEKALLRVIPSFFQTYVCGVKANKELVDADRSEKLNQKIYSRVSEVLQADERFPSIFKREIAQFIRAAFGLKSPFSPQGKEYYETKVSGEIAEIFSIMNTDRQRHSLLRNFFEQRDISQRPMTSLRDVDKPGQIVPSRGEVRSSRTIPDDVLLEVMRFIRSGSGAAVDDSAREGE